MKALSKKKSSKKKSKLAYIHKICDMTIRGDIHKIKLAMKGYWKDKRKHPWHRIYKLIDKYWEKEEPDRSLSETIVLLRDAVFGVLEMHSLSLALDVSTDEILKKFVKGESFADGRRETRSMCAKLVAEMIEEQKLDYLYSSALERDGFGYLVPLLEHVQLKRFKDARPVEKDGEISLTKLMRTRIGAKLLREQEILDKKLKAEDPRTDELIECFDHLILELEVDEEVHSEKPVKTEQMRLDGKPVDELVEIDGYVPTKRLAKGVQTPLSEYLEPSVKGNEEEEEEPKKRRRGSRKRRKKKGK